MKKRMNQLAAICLGACLAAASVTGCAKKELDPTAAVATLDGEEVSAGLYHLFLRYQQAQFQTYYGAYFGTTDIWNQDLTGSGEAYGESFKDTVMDELEKMLLAEKHMDEYGVSLSDADKAKISEAAAAFLADNTDEVKNAISADEPTVKRMMELYAIRTKMEAVMPSDVDTEVSDEEAAQRTISYALFKPVEESEEESESETETAAAETETSAETKAEEETAAIESETDTDKTTSAEAAEADTDEETEAKTETEAETEPKTEADAETEAKAAADTEAGTEADTETESETELAEPTEAELKAEALAEEMIEKVKAGEDFEETAKAVSEDVVCSTMSFGEDEEYVKQELIDATRGVADGTLIETPIRTDNGYYVVRVDKAFDEEKTEQKKESIVTQRKNDRIAELYEEWQSEAAFEVDEKVLDKIDFNDTMEILITEAETEAVTEAAAEAATEAVSEAGSEAETLNTETDTEAVSEVEEITVETESEAAETAAETETEGTEAETK